MSGEKKGDLALEPFQRQVIDFFCDGARLIGLPRSVAEIYGVLYISPDPLSLDDLVERLAMSKGSASQGLRTLRDLGAVKLVEMEGKGRRSYYEPDVELRQLVGGFIKEQVRPHLRSGEEKLRRLEEALPELLDEKDREFYKSRLDRLERWSLRARLLLPVVQKLLGQ